MSGNWADVREAGVLPVANALGGIELKRPGSPRHGLTPCPACGVDDRSTEHHHDPKRGPIGLTRDHMGWCCHVCGVKGDAVTLASWLCGQGGKVNREVAVACRQAGILGDTPRQPRPPPPPRVPEYLPNSELRKFTKLLVPIDEEPSIGAWLLTRRIDPCRVLDLGVTKALPQNAMAPSWAQCKGQQWARAGYRLIAPLYDVNGRMRSFHARAVVDLDPKSGNPAGYEQAGLTLACPLAKLWLHGDTLGDDKTLAVDWVKRVGLVIVEGLPDWLTQLTKHSDADVDAPAVIGIMSGSWTKAHAEKVPDGCVVGIATDSDKDGNKYAAMIGKTLAGRVDLRRWKSSEVER